MQILTTHEAINDAAELVQPILVELCLRLARRLSGIHASVYVLRAGETLVQHLLDGGLLTAPREQLLHGLLLLADEVAKVDEVLIEVHDATRVDRDRAGEQIDLPATGLCEQVSCSRDRKLDVVVSDRDDLGLNVHANLF